MNTSTPENLQFKGDKGLFYCTDIFLDSLLKYGVTPAVNLKKKPLSFHGECSTSYKPSHEEVPHFHPNGKASEYFLTGQHKCPKWSSEHHKNHWKGDFGFFQSASKHTHLCVYPLSNCQLSPRPPSLYKIGLKSANRFGCHKKIKAKPQFFFFKLRQKLQTLRNLSFLQHSSE